MISLLTVCWFLRKYVIFEAIEVGLSCELLAGRTQFVNAFFNENKEETYPKHQQTARKGFLEAFQKHLTSHELSKQGPYVIGKTFTYADMVIYQVLHDESLTQDGMKGLQEYPRLRQLAEEVEGRSNIKAFKESDRYLG